MTLAVSYRRIAATLVCIAGLLSALSLAGQWLNYGLGVGPLGGLVRLFNVDEEVNVPSWFSASCLLLCALTVGVIAWSKSAPGAPFARHWAVIALGFTALSLDEAAEIHERINRPLRDLLHDRMMLPWTLPAALFVVGVLLAFRTFLRHLPRPTRIRCLAAGCLYVTGALGGELVSGRYAAVHGAGNMTYAMLATAEETCEMLGVIGFLYTFLTYLAAEGGEYTFRIGA